VNTSGSFTITNFAVSFHIPKWRAKVSLGQMREDFGYEVIDSTAKLPQSERTLTPFTSPVNAGIKVVQSLGHNDRMTLSYGIFKNEWGDGDGKLAFAGRLTGLVIDQPDRRRFLHLGVGIRDFGSKGTLSYDGKPGVHAADTFVDTGVFPASGATHIGLEVQYSDGPWSILAEHITAIVHSAETGNPRLRGTYVIGSWFVTGENRLYDRAAGVVSRVTPKGRWGALELTSRLSRVDLDDGAIRGGAYIRLEFGANWWATTRWKLGLLAGRIWLDRFGVESRTDTVMTRLQWVY
jgi:phosphate-selective porin